MIILCGGMGKGVGGQNSDVWHLGTLLTMEILEEVSSNRAQINQTRYSQLASLAVNISKKTLTFILNTFVTLIIHLFNQNLFVPTKLSGSLNRQTH